MTIHQLSNTPDRADEVEQLNAMLWPEFMLHGNVRRWSELYTTLAEFQLLVLAGDRLAGAGLTVPCAWQPGQPPPETIDEVVYHAAWPLAGTKGVLCALAALVHPDHRGQGLSRTILTEMTRLAVQYQLAGVIAPVRPTRKHEFPHEPIESYVDRREEHGCLFDPWLRVHEDVGGQRLGIAHKAFTVRGSVADWQNWTGQTHDTSGQYTVPGALNPVHIDCESDVGVYEEPNVWYFHKV